MLRKFALPASTLILLTCGGCYTNRAVIDPWSYAPSSPSSNWIPPKNVKPMALSDEPPDLPGQEDPYSLGELIDIALRNNQQTRITWAQARSAAANYGQTQSQFFPEFTGNFTYQRGRQPSFTSTGTTPAGSGSGVNNPSASSTLGPTTVVDNYYSFWSPELTISYLLYDFGTLRATSEAARQALYNADWTHNDAILSLLQTIMNDFYNYLYQKQLLTADVANVETARLTLEAAQVGFDTGVRDISDVLQSTTQLLQNQTTWASQQQNVETAYTTMLNDMGLPANITLKTQDLPTTLPTNDIVPPVETLISIALQNRPDLLAAEANLKSKQQSLLAAKRQFLPQFNYNFDLAKNYYNGGLHDQYNFTSTFTVSMPLFQGFFYRNAIKIAEANKEAAEDQVKQSELSMIQQITSYHYNVKVAYETLQFATAFLAAAEEQYVVALAQYKQGTNTILNVVSAQSSLADARASQANAIQQWFTSLANLAYATGILSPNYLMPFGNEEEVHIADFNPHPQNQQINLTHEAAENEETR
ncbi:MAG: TolC family protein [Verrucomicrobia bacterium]|nr:TolC family protein [Verrucomicrobiota bacterium]